MTKFHHVDAEQAEVGMSGLQKLLHQDEVAAAELAEFEAAADVARELADAELSAAAKEREA